MSYLNDGHSDNCGREIYPFDPSQALTVLAMHGPKTTGLNA
ncbi:hypothetical protein L63ED372_00513 [Limnohabitans sp. 63ED37-2]|nr:hypothetical protein L63ED372_00513 [Limnohabitans sp. 63ED37-2]